MHFLLITTLTALIVSSPAAIYAAMFLRTPATASLRLTIIHYWFLGAWVLPLPFALYRALQTP